MENTSVNLPAMTIVGIARRQSNDRTDLIGKQWEDFFKSGGINQIPNRKSTDIYAVYTEYEGDHTRPYTMVIGCEVSEGSVAPSGMVAKTVPAGRYAVFNAAGPQPAGVMSAWKQVMSAPIVRAYAADFDRYRSREDVEVHVGVR